MSELKAFIGHSFTNDDKDVVRQFLDFFNNVKDIVNGFSWEHAEPAEPKVLSDKVLKLMENKNLFIGICTVKEKVISPEELKGTLFSKKTQKANINDFCSKTSDWIIQEIGVAIGKGMYVIILKENGLRDPGGLQGDIEYIPFNRNEPSKSFNKILEMLKALSPKKSIGMVSPVESEIGEDRESGQEKVEKLESNTNLKRKDYERELLRAILRDDKTKEQKIIDDYIKSEEGRRDTDKESFYALKHYYRIIFGIGANIKELQQMRNDYSDNGAIAYYLGRAYKEYKDLDKAAEQYENSAVLAKNDQERLYRYCTTAVTRCENGDNDAETWLLNKVRDFNLNVDDGELDVISHLKTINKIQKNDDKYLAFAEKALDLRPDNYDLRFELAHKYSDLGNNEFALFHYMLILDKDLNAATWNNIGVANARLNIDGKAVEAYQKSKDLNETLAMSNLARKLMSSGFLKEAEELCNHAVTIENYNSEIGATISCIEETKEKENEKQKEILKNTEKRRKFYVDFGQQCLNGPVDDQEGIWIGPECELNIKINNCNFVAESSDEQQNIGGLLVRQNLENPKKTKKNIRYEGIIQGLGIEFKLFIDIEGTRRTLLTGLIDDAPSKNGLMIISKDFKSIRVYEKGTKETEKFYELRKK